ncbi:MAG: hypothetical protein IH959_08370, partial [Chloroflexi bacterium]|nr:hypothetical protein [Chloroflexota bacterium]
MSEEPIVLSVPGHAELHLATRSGRITVTAEERTDVQIESEGRLRDKIETDATGRISVRSPRGGSAPLEVRCPIGADVVAGTVAGRVELRGQLGAVRVTTISGSVDVERADSVDVRSVAGNIEVGHCEGRCRLQTKSGRVVCEAVGEAQVSTLSGRIRLGEARSVVAQSASGKIDVGLQGKGDVVVQTMSGAVRVEVPPGVRPNARLRSLSGKPRCECEEGDDCEIKI